MSISINLEKLLDYQKEILKHDDLRVQSLENALQSIIKKKSYCLYHRDRVAWFSEGSDLRLDRIGQFRPPNETVSLRVIYESHIFSFIQDLHSLVDSFPYIINIIYQVVDDPEARSVSWSPKFISRMKKYEFYDDIESFRVDKDFNKLKALTNIIKHKRLVPIGNDYEKVFISEYDIEIDGELIHIPQEDALEFMTKAYNSLVHKLFNLYNKVFPMAA